MPYKPFLSHKREQASELELLRDELVLRGAGGWQDVAELRLGQRFKAAFSRAIGRETGGFIWWGTPAALKSTTIRRVEVPLALRRSRSRRDGPYPFVPLFVDVRPGRDDAAIKKAFGRRRGQQLLDLQGLVRDDDEALSDFARKAARRYVHDLIREHDKPELRVAVTGGRPPSGHHDLALDWRRLLDADGRVADSAVLPTLTETLSDIRNAAHETWDCPHLIVQPTVRLPLGALIGWEWNRVRPIKLTVVQPSGRGAMEVEDLVGDTSMWPSPQPDELGGDGPAVLAVSVGKDLGGAVQRYSESQEACEAVHLHVDLGRYPGGVLPAPDICSLAEWVIGHLADLNARGLSKHLLLLGPVSLAVRIGAAANGTGRTFVPFWDGADGYTSGVFIG
jgi:hypothetical protein